MDFLKKQSGVTMIALTITIIVLLIVTSITLVNMQSSLKDKKLDRLYGDISAIQSKLDIYYIKYNELPLKGEYCSKIELNTILINNGVKSEKIKLNSSDNGKYYVIDLDKLENLTLNYGSDYKNWKNGTDLKNLYIINETSHQIYYPKTINVEGEVYYYYQINTDNISFSDSIDFDGITISANVQTDYIVATYGTVNLTANISISSDSKPVNKYKYQYSWNSTNIENLEIFNDFELGESNTIQIDSNKVGKGSYYLWIKLIDEYGNEHVECINKDNQIIVEETNIKITLRKIAEIGEQKIDNGIVEIYVEYNNSLLTDIAYGQGKELDEAKKNISGINNIICEQYENKIVRYTLDANVEVYFYVQAKDERGNLQSAYIYINNPIITVNNENATSLRLNNNVTNFNLKDYKIYGNSIQEKTPTLNEPVEIQSVGDMVQDSTDANYGKYKIPMTISGKNLGNFPSEKTLISIQDQTNNFTSIGSSVVSNLKNDTKYLIKFDYEILSNTDVDYWVGTAVGPMATALSKSFSKPLYGKFHSATDTEINHGTYSMIVTSLPTCDFQANPYFTLGISCGTYTYEWNHATFSGSVKITNVMLCEYNDEYDIEEYEPYIEPITTDIYLNEPLRKVNDICDYLDYKNQKVIRKIGEISKEWQYYNSVDYGIYHKISLLSTEKNFKRNSLNILTNKFSIVTTFPGSENINKVMVDGRNIYNLEKDYDSTVFFSLANPTVICYELEDDIEEEIKLPEQLLKNKTMIVNIGTKTTPSKIEATFVSNKDS